MNKVKLFTLFSMCAIVSVFAQDAAPSSAPALAIPLPEAWSSNAIVVLCVNFGLALVALLAKKIPGNIGKIVQAIVDLFSANPKH